MLEKLLTEQPNPASASIDTLPTEQVLRIINAEDQKVAAAVEREIPAIARAVDAIVAALENGGRLFYIGAGTSGRLGVLDASEIPPTFSVPPELVQGIMAGGEAALSRATETTEDDPAIGVRDLSDARLHGTGRAGGNRGQRAHALRAGRGGGGQAAGRGHGRNQLHAGFRAVARGGYCDRAAGRAGDRGRHHAHEGRHRQKLVLNMLSTGTFIRLGYVYGNLMVNVQPKNEKLVDRARRIVAQAAGVSPRARRANCWRRAATACAPRS